jgi:hypothetical protein
MLAVLTHENGGIYPGRGTATHELADSGTAAIAATSVPADDPAQRISSAETDCHRSCSETKFDQISRRRKSAGLTVFRCLGQARSWRIPTRETVVAFVADVRDRILIIQRAASPRARLRGGIALRWIGKSWTGKRPWLGPGLAASVSSVPIRGCAGCYWRHT